VRGARSVSVASLKASDVFEPRHNSNSAEEDMAAMLEVIGAPSLDALVEATVPTAIKRPAMEMPFSHQPMTETQFLEHMAELADKNVVNKSFMGMGYYGTHTPTVILRNILENPGWYTQYTPYQAEISQGRLESLLNFQSMVVDLTGMPMCNASLLDEATACAEAMTMCSAIARGKKPKFYISDLCHPQNIEVCKSRADGLGLEVIVGDHRQFDLSAKDVCGVLLQYPATDGSLESYKAVSDAAHANNIKVCAAVDLLSLTVLQPPSTWGADMVVGSSQRFGVPMGYGGPHAAFLATSDEYKRLMPGRIIGVSKDANGDVCLRMAMQTREQHIRRDKATSNICTAQALLANVAAMYAVYHGPDGLKRIANRVHGLAAVFAAGAEKLGAKPTTAAFFDTVSVQVANADAVLATGHAHGVNLRKISDTVVSVAFDETHTISDLDTLFAVLNGGTAAGFTAESIAEAVDGDASIGAHARQGKILDMPVFNRYHTEHEMVRYVKALENKDLSMVHSMIALGSCTMKLNATSEMIPITWPKLANLHPYAPLDQAAGYQEMLLNLAKQLCDITGFDAMSMQPNSGASGEYAGLMTIRAYHQSRGDGHRNICLIPTSAHGTNPATASMVGYKIVPIPTDKKGNVNYEVLKAEAEKHKDNLAALMITYPSTFGVYEEGIDQICQTIHDNGGQVYMDGANMNAQVGLTSPGHIGADVCHLNLHKTFCIPHGGGGPGMGPIGVKAHLAPFLPTHPVVPTGALPAEARGPSPAPFGTMAAAPYGSSMILPISYGYICMMGSQGLTNASKQAIMNANYLMRRLENHFKVQFTGRSGTCAHEFIIDVEHIVEGIKAEDVAKRLIDYGFHAPTMSWPVPGTLMIEPTESESKEELDRFADTMIAIRAEMQAIKDGVYPLDNNPLVNAPHPAKMVVDADWDSKYPYSRETAAFPAPWVSHGSKFWPTHRRVDNVFGDRHLLTNLQTAGSTLETAAEKIAAIGN